MKLLQSLAASCTLLLASILAHMLAGGAVISAQSLVAISLSSLAIMLILLRGFADPIKVSIAIFLAQNLGHFILGGQASSEFTMFFAHGFAGVVSYQLLRFFQRELPSLGSILRILFPALPIFLHFAPLTIEIHPNFFSRPLAISYFAFTVPRRGPPLY